MNRSPTLLRVTLPDSARATDYALMMLGRALVAVTVVSLTAAGQRQPPSPSWEAYRRDSVRWIRDSIALDSAARTLPTDSLRAYYRRLPTTNQPVRVLHELWCESYRLHYRFLRVASVAEDRVRAEEWPVAVQPAVRRAMRAWYDLFVPSLQDSKRWPDTLPPRMISANRDECPVSLLWERTAFLAGSYPPTPPDSTVPGSPEWYRKRYGPADGTIGGSDSLIRAASAVLEFRGWDLLVLSITDRKTFYALEFHRRGDEFLRPGIYPVFNGPRPRGDTNSFWLNSIHDPPDPVQGTVTIERADTLGVEGHLELVMHRNGASSSRWRLPADSVVDIPIRIRFRAAYDRSREWSLRPFNPPAYPHPWNPAPLPPPDARLLNPLYRDANAACSSLPIYRRESVVGGLPADAWVAQATGRMEITLDTLGRPAYVTLLSVTDTSLLVRQAFYQKGTAGLRFVPAQPTGDHRFGVVRCSLTLRRSGRD